MSPETCVIVNPQSGRGRGARLLPELRAAFAGADIRLTATSGDEERAAREAIEEGFAKIVAVGGDGTWSNVGHAIIESRRSGRSGAPALGLVPGGTGCDLARSLGIPQTDVRACAEIVAAGQRRPIDAGRVDGRTFLNVAGFGFDIAVLERSRNIRWLRGELLYLYCALRELKAYRGFEVEGRLDGATSGPSGRHMMIIVANARQFGGGFKIAPSAELDDGVLDIVAFGELRFLERVRAMARLLRGTHGSAKGIRTWRSRVIDLEFDAPPAFETDGEWRHASSRKLSIESLPAALDVLVPARA